jgi:hypothetical protein
MPGVFVVPGGFWKKSDKPNADGQEMDDPGRTRQDWINRIGFASWRRAKPRWLKVGRFLGSHVVRPIILPYLRRLGLDSREQLVESY